MPGRNEPTTKFKVDISELKAGIAEANRLMKHANSEFKAASSGMDDWSKSSDGISAKLKQLRTNLESQEKVLAEYKKTLEEVKKEYGENSKEAMEYASKLNNQQAAVNKTKKEIDKYEDSLQEVAKAEKVAAKTGQDVSDVLDEMHKKAEDAGDGFTTLKGAVATFAGNVMTSLAGSIRDGISSLVNLASETREYREDLAKLETAYKTAGLSTEDATKVYKEFYAVLGEEDRSVEAVNHLAKFAKGQEDLTKWTTIATGVWGTFGDSLPIEGLTEAANETMKTGKLTGVLVDALVWAGKSEDEFQASLDKCTSEQERQALITDTLNGLYSDAATNYREVNASVINANKVNSDYTDTMAQMGAKIEPVTTALKAGFTGLLQELLKLVSDVDMEAFTSKIEEGFGVLKNDVLPAVKEGLGWILDNKDTLVAGLAAIGAGFVAFKVASLIQGAVSAMQGMTVAQYALNLAMSLNPIGIIIALIAGLVAAFVVLWNKSDSFRNFWIKLWENIKAGFTKSVDSIVKFFTETIPDVFNGVINFIKENWQTLLLLLINPFAGLFKYFYENNTQFKQFVDTAISFIKQLPSKAWTWLSQTIQKVVAWGVDLVAKGRQAAGNLFDAIVNKIKAIPSEMLTIGKNIVEGLWNGINDMAGWISSKIQGFGDSVLSGIKNFFGINSPSKVFADEVGKWIPEGIAVGIDKNAKSALNSMKDMATNVVGVAKNGLSTNLSSSGISTSGGSARGAINNYNFYQTNNSPKALSRYEIYRQSKNLLNRGRVYV